MAIKIDLIIRGLITQSGTTTKPYDKISLSIETASAQDAERIIEKIKEVFPI